MEENLQESPQFIRQLETQQNQGLQDLDSKLLDYRANLDIFIKNFQPSSKEFLKYYKSNE